MTALPLFPTTLVGSYPQPDWLIDRAKLAGRFPPRVRARELWFPRPEALDEAQEDATVLAIRAQESAGLDVLTDGESAGRATPTTSRPRSTASTSTTPARRWTAAATRTRCRGWSARSAGPARSSAGDLRVPQGQHRPARQGDRARPVHDVAAGAGRLLRRPTLGRARLRRRVQRGGARPVRRGGRHRPARRALHAGPAGAGPGVRAGGAQPGPGRCHRHDRRAHLLRLRRDHPRPPVGLLLPAGAGRLPVRPGVDRDGAVGPGHVGAQAPAGQDDHARRARPVRRTTSSRPRSSSSGPGAASSTSTPTGWCSPRTAA